MYKKVDRSKKRTLSQTNEKNRTSLDWCIVLGEDENWWVESISDKENWDVEDLGIMTGNFCISMMIDSMTEFGLDSQLVDNFYC